MIIEQYKECGIDAAEKKSEAPVGSRYRHRARRCHLGGTSEKRTMIADRLQRHRQNVGNPCRRIIPAWAEQAHVTGFNIQPTRCWISLS